MNSNEKYPVKRAYAVGKLYKFLKQKGIYKEFVAECKKQKSIKANVELSGAIIWHNTKQGFNYWLKINIEFNYYLQGVDVDKT